jgi:hypothetical protein
VTGNGKSAPLALDLLNATAAEARSLLDDAKAMKSKETENATELRWVYSFSPALRRWSGLRLGDLDI